MQNKIAQHTSFMPNWKNLWSFIKDQRADWKPKAFACLAILYLVWPLDLLPDLIPFLGWLDDLGATSLAIAYLLHTANAYGQAQTLADDEKKTLLMDSDQS